MMNDAKAMMQAKKLPPPMPGLTLDHLSFEVLSAYLELHELEVERFSGGMVTVRKARAEAGSMREVAERLAKVGE